MARYVKDIVLNQPNDFVSYIMNDFLNKEGYKLVTFKGEQVYRSGGGWFEMPKFITWTYVNGVFHLEAWVRVLWLPGVYGRENPVKGIYGAVPKKMFRSSLEELEQVLQQSIPNATAQNVGNPNVGMNNNYPVMNGNQNIGANNNNSGVNGMPNQGMNNNNPNMNGMPNQGMNNNNPNMNGMPNQGMNYNNQNTVYVQSTDTKRYAGMALGFGIAGFVGLLIPIVGIIFGSLGIIYGKKAMNGSKKGMATAAFVIGIITVCLSALNWLLGIILYSAIY